MRHSKQVRLSKGVNFNFKNIERGRYHVIVKEEVTSAAGKSKLPKLYFIVPGQGDNVCVECFEPLLEYYEDHSSMSYSWKKNTARAIGLLVDYSMAMSASPDFGKWKDRGLLERKLFRGLAKALRNGTEDLDKNGRVVDPTRLYWRPLGLGQASVLLSSLTNYFRWLREDLSNSDWINAADTTAIAQHPIIALKMATELRFRRETSLLGHLKGIKKPPAHPYPFIVKRPSKNPLHVPTFPAKYVGPFLNEGFVHEDGEVDEAAQLIAYLLFGLGLRKSESFHLFVTDIQFINDVPWIFFHHPEFGKVDSGTTGTITRREYLQRFGLLPRNIDTGRNKAGWKGMDGEGEGTPGIWLPADPIRNRASFLLRRYLLITRPAIMAARPKSLSDHPFLLVNPRRIDGPDTGDIGDPYTLTAFDGAWSSAVTRIGKRFNDPDMKEAKRSLGTTPHCARHFAGRFLYTAGVEGPLIKSFLRHKSLESHKAYTRLTSGEINQILQEAAERAPGHEAFRDLRETFTSQFETSSSSFNQ
jgi:hypothetical protein